MPSAAPDRTAFFARTNFRNERRTFGIKRADRRAHMYVIGKTGTGKSTLLETLIAQDIAHGEGVALLDAFNKQGDSPPCGLVRVLNTHPRCRTRTVVARPWKVVQIYVGNRGDIQTWRNGSALWSLRGYSRPLPRPKSPSALSLRKALSALCSLSLRRALTAGF
jgi:hypothetical protein